ncbi:heparinase II/III domain-containing protein [Puniceicoccus vermicola]|uniref:Heparinase II/III family protein n=1 Tax=Puniceicoccus vermicola TaxID=388746 RepID=A0A7X1AZB6_9BACT|nr:heparinase II/III family protein [Puniceicoccus vermicola]MBC2602731.1 heparinase II/III family protein [Puniceicoccus vermicola]
MITPPQLFRWASVAFVASMHISTQASRAETQSFGERLDSIHPESAHVETTQILEKAAAIAQGPILERADSVADMEPNSGKRVTDSRAKWKSLLERKPDAAEPFALASGDMGASRILFEELPLLAATYRINGSPEVKDYMIRQLEEIATWSPFQRPGWTLPHRKDELPPEGDGVWLATGTMLQTLALVFDILPEDTLPDDLVESIRTRMREEVELTYDHWVREIPWYVQKEASHSNQWIVPASGMLIGAISLGEEDLQDAYELGLKSLTLSLANTGSDGSMNEGYIYALSWSMRSLILANHFMNETGNQQFAKNRFFTNLPGWIALFFQPGGNLVNAFDGFRTQTGEVNAVRPDVTFVAGITGDASLQWVINNILEGPSPDFSGLLVLAESSQPVQPSLWGVFEKSSLLIWRSSWNTNASGLWARGGDVDDFHDHHDRGHVNFIVDGVPILIESGTPGYSHPQKKQNYDSAMGHNVLLWGEEIYPAKQPAGIQVTRLSEEGGIAAIDLQSVYNQLESYTRHLEWSTRNLIVKDTLTASESDAQPASIRWHLSSDSPLEIEEENGQFVVRVPSSTKNLNHGKKLELPAVQISIRSNIGITVQEQKHPDHTLKFRSQNNLHTVLEIRADAPVTDWTLETEFDVQ